MLAAACLDDVLHCAAQVHVVELQLSQDEASRRHAAANAAAAAGLEVADLGAEASQGLLGEASFMPQQPQLAADAPQQVMDQGCGCTVP